MTDFATLGLKVQRQEVDEGTAALDRLTAAAGRAETATSTLQGGFSRMNPVARDVAGVFRDGIEANGHRAESALRRVEFASYAIVESGNLSAGSLRGLSIGLSNLLGPAGAFIGVGIVLVETLKSIAKADEEQQAAADAHAETQRKWIQDHYTAATTTHELAIQRLRLAQNTRDLARAEDELGIAIARQRIAQLEGDRSQQLGRGLASIVGGALGQFGLGFSAFGASGTTLEVANADVDRLREHIRLLQTDLAGLNNVIRHPNLDTTARDAAIAKRNQDLIETADRYVQAQQDAGLKELHAFKDVQNQEEDARKAGIEQQIQLNDAAVTEFERSWDHA